MSANQRVLFPVDFSVECHALMPTVRKMLARWQAEVTLLHVVEPRRWLGRKAEVQRLMAHIPMIAGETLLEQNVHCRLERGAPGDRILDYVREHPVDLIVMSAGRSSKFHGNPVGEVSDQVLAEAPCPVWLDWTVVRARAAAGMNARQVCCALELDESDERIFRKAAQMSEELDAVLTAVHALFPSRGEPLDVLWDQRVRERELDTAAKRVASLRTRFCPSSACSIDVGSRHTVLSRVLRSLEAGLLVTGNQRDAILAAESECPVLRLPASASAALAVQPRYLAAGTSA